MSSLIGHLQSAGNISGSANFTKGEKGEKGDTGRTPVFSIGKVNDIDEHSGAQVTITGTPEEPVLNFDIPHGWKGDKGDKGDKGGKGDQGVSGVYVGSGEMPEGYNVQVDPSSEAKGVFPDLAIGVVETLEAGEKATASVTGPDDAPVLNLGIPKGDRGERGVSGVYVGEGDMPEGYSVQVNPNGDATTDKPWVLVDDITLEKDAREIVVNLPANTYKEVWVDGVFIIATEETTAKSTQFVIGRDDCTINRRDVSVSNGTKLYYRAHGFLSPKGTMMYDVSIANYQYTGGSLSRNAGDMINTPFTHFNMVRFWLTPTTQLLAAGSTFTVWGR